MFHPPAMLRAAPAAIRLPPRHLPQRSAGRCSARIRPGPKSLHGRSNSPARQRLPRALRTAVPAPANRENASVPQDLASPTRHPPTNRCLTRGLRAGDPAAPRASPRCGSPTAGSRRAATTGIPICSPRAARAPWHHESTARPPTNRVAEVPRSGASGRAARLRDAANRHCGSPTAGSAGWRRGTGAMRYEIGNVAERLCAAGSSGRAHHPSTNRRLMCTGQRNAGAGGLVS